jgi:hypothetical protein
MPVERAKRLVATAVLILFVPGGASTAPADAEPAADDGPRAAVLQPTPARVAQRQRRAEAAWLAEQVHAARPRPQRAATGSPRQAETIAAMWRASVPQQPPRIVSPGRRSRSST